MFDVLEHYLGIITYINFIYVNSVVHVDEKHWKFIAIFMNLNLKNYCGVTYQLMNNTYK